MPATTINKPVKLGRHDRMTHLALREKFADADYISVVSYGPGEMEELFSDDERNALECGFQVIRGKCTWVDALQAALKTGL